MTTAAESLAHRYFGAAQSRDLETLREVLHPDLVVRYPQSGEVIRGADNFLAMLADYPGGMPQATMVKSYGDKPHVVTQQVPFGMPIITVIGGSDHYVAELVARYPDGSEWFSIWIGRIHEGRIIEDTGYFGQAFEPPDWRQQYTSSSEDDG